MDKVPMTNNSYDFMEAELKTLKVRRKTKYN